MNGRSENQSLSELLSELATSSAALVRDEIQLAERELRENVAGLRAGLVGAGIGAVLGLVALLSLAAAAIAGLAHIMDVSLAALLVGVVLALACAVAGSIAAKHLKQAKLKPRRTIETLEEDKEWLKHLA